MNSTNTNLNGITGETMGDLSFGTLGDSNILPNRGTLPITGNYYNLIPSQIKILKINGKTIFYYWSGSFFYYSLFDDKKSKDGDTIIFETTDDFIQVLKDLNLLVK